MFEPSQEKLDEAAAKVQELIVDHGAYAVHAIGVTGSHAYGTAHADSDLDIRGIYSMDTEHFLLPSSGSTVINYMDRDNGIDITLWEITHFCNLALHCNPNLLEFLWLPEHMYLDNTGARLLNLRWDFLSAPAIRKNFGGFAKGQITRAQRDGMGHDKKLFKHALRTTLGGIELLQTGEFAVRLEPDTKTLVEGFMFLPSDLRIQYIETLIQILDNTCSDLPAEPSKSQIIDMLGYHRLEQLKNFLS
jgi:predicted nucleotidyltransferase